MSTESEYSIHPEQTELLTLPEAAQWAGVSLPTIKGWLRGGHLASVRAGARRFIRTADLSATLATAYLDGVVPAWREDPRRAGLRLRVLREAAGLNQIALGARTDLSHEFISRLETGHSWPRAGSIRALAQALGVEPEAFVSSDPVGLTLLTVAEAAARLDVPPLRVQEWVLQGHLAGRKVSGQWRVPAVVVAELARSGRLRGRSRRLDPLPRVMILQKPRLVDDQDRSLVPQVLHHVRAQIVAHRLGVPARGAQQALHPIRASLAQVLSNGSACRGQQGRSRLFLSLFHSDYSDFSESAGSVLSSLSSRLRRFMASPSG